MYIHRRYIKTVLNLEKGARAIVCNGQLIGPLDDDEEFTNEDFSLLERFTQSTYDDKLLKKLIKGQLLENDEYGMIKNQYETIYDIKYVIYNKYVTFFRFFI